MGCARRRRFVSRRGRSAIGVHEPDPPGAVTVADERDGATVGRVRGGGRSSRRRRSACEASRRWWSSSTRSLRHPGRCRTRLRVPSGDQAGARSRAACSVRLVWPAPSASITKISASPVRVLLNAMRLPFGDHTGCVSAPAATVMRVRFEPSASITKMSASPERVLEYAMREQSGDQAGSRSAASCFVIRVCSHALARHREDVDVAVDVTRCRRCARRWGWVRPSRTWP